jgi:hypothetical protein
MLLRYVPGELRTVNDILTRRRSLNVVARPLTAVALEFEACAYNTINECAIGVPRELPIFRELKRNGASVIAFTIVPEPFINAYTGIIVCPDALKSWWPWTKYRSSGFGG